MEIVDILSWVVLGGVAGWLASIVTGKDASFGVFANVLVGVAGAFIGGWLWSLLGQSESSDLASFDWTSFFIAFGGAVVLLMVLKLFSRN